MAVLSPVLKCQQNHDSIHPRSHLCLTLAVLVICFWSWQVAPGWVSAAEFTDGDLCDLTGMTVPLHRTRAERLSAGDPRKSLEELYGDHEGYVKAIKEAAKALRKAGFLLKEDEEQVIQEAESSDVLK